VPPAALVLNMARFTAPDTGAVYYPLGGGPGDAGGGALRALAQRYAIPGEPHELPMDARLSAAGDSGMPLVLALPQSDLAAAYARLAGEVVAVAERNTLAADAAANEAAAAAAAASASASASAEAPAAAAAANTTAAATAAGVDSAIFSASLGDDTSVSLRYSAARAAFLLRRLSPAGASERALPAAAVRLACRCAACVDEATGAVRISAAALPAGGVHPTRLTAQGSYGVAVAWSDGHDTGIYTFVQLAALADGQAQQATAAA